MSPRASLLDASFSLLWVSAGSMFHFWCPVTDKVRTNEQQHRETYLHTPGHLGDSCAASSVIRVFPAAVCRHCRVPCEIDLDLEIG